MENMQVIFNKVFYCGCVNSVYQNVVIDLFRPFCATES